MPLPLFLLNGSQNALPRYLGTMVHRLLNISALESYNLFVPTLGDFRQRQRVQVPPASFDRPRGLLHPLDPLGTPTSRKSRLQRRKL